MIGVDRDCENDLKLGGLSGGHGKTPCGEVGPGSAAADSDVFAGDFGMDGLPTGLEEIAQLGRTLWRRRNDILAFCDRRASNGPTEAISGRLEALRRNALGFRNLTLHRWRSLLHSGALHQLVNAL
jgi:Transposase